MTEIYNMFKARKDKDGLTEKLKMKIGRAYTADLLTDGEFDELMDLIPRNGV